MHLGALTSKPSAFRYRSWEIFEHFALDLHDTFGANTLVYTRGTEIMRILPRLNTNLNNNLITDRARFSYDALLKQRITVPYLGIYHNFIEEKQMTPLTNNEALSFLTEVIDTSDQIHTLFGPYLSVAQLKITNELLYTYFNTKRIQNFSQAMQTIEIDSIYNTTYKKPITMDNNLEEIVLIGANLRLEMPLLYFKLLQKLKDNPLLFCYTLMASLPQQNNIINLGNDTSLLMSIISGKHLFNRKLVTKKSRLFIFGTKIENTLREKFLDYIDSIKKINNTYEHLKHYISTYASKAQSKQQVITMLPDTTSLILPLLGLTLNKSFNFIFKDSRNQLDKVVLAVNTDKFHYDNFHYANIIYMGSHADRATEVADLVFPIKTIYEYSGAFFNYACMLQSFTKIMDNTEAPCGILDTFISFNSFFNLLTRRNILFPTNAGVNNYQQIFNFSEFFTLPQDLKTKIFNSNNNHNRSKVSSLLLEYLSIGKDISPFFSRQSQKEKGKVTSALYLNSWSSRKSVLSGAREPITGELIPFVLRSVSYKIIEDSIFPMTENFDHFTRDSLTRNSTLMSLASKYHEYYLPNFII